MCNLNQVCGGLQKCHYSCCRQKMHNCFGKRYKPCCCCGDKLLDIDGTEQEAYPPLNWVLKCPLLQKTSNICGNRNSEYIKNVAKKRQAGKVAPQTNLTGKKISKVSPTTSSSLTSQGSQRNKGSCVCSIPKKEKLLSGSSLSACTSRKANSFKPVQKNQKPLEEKATKRKCRKQKPEQMENRRSLLKTKPKNKKLIGSKMLSRSTGGDADDGIWFECNLPLRVNIPMPINMNSLFGSRSFSSKTNSENCRALVPAGNIQEDRKLELPWLFDFTLTQADQPPTLESNSLSSKSITFTRKKGLRRGKKSSPCEISTQTIEEESDPVLSCLEQIRCQLAEKSFEEKKICRCFAEKSTSVRILQKEKNTTDVKLNHDDKNEQQTTSTTKKISKLKKTKKDLPKFRPKSKCGIEPRKISESINESKFSCIAEVTPSCQPEFAEESKKLDNTDSSLKSPPRITISPSLPHFIKIMPWPALQSQEPKPGSKMCTPTIIKHPTIDNQLISVDQERKWLPKNDSKINSNTSLKYYQISMPQSVKQIPRQSNQKLQDNNSMNRNRFDSSKESLKTTKTISSYEASDKTSNSQPSKRHFPNYFLSKKNINKESKESFSSSEKSFEHKSTRSSETIISTSLYSFSSKSNKSPEESEIISFKTQKQKSLNNIRCGKPNQYQSNRISSGGEIFSGGPSSLNKVTKNRSSDKTQHILSKALRTNQEQLMVNKRGSDISKHSRKSACQRNSQPKRLQNNKESEKDIYTPNCQNNKKLDVVRKSSKSSLSESFRTVEKSCSNTSKSSGQSTSLKNYSSNKYSQSQIGEETIPVTSKSEIEKQLSNIPVAKNTNMQQSEHKNLKRPRSQSAPEYWILERVKSENSSYKSALSKHTASLFSRNPRKGPENVLVLQDETCESETDEYEMGGYTFCEMENDCKETSQTTCSECKTADYSINANILKELKNQEESLNSSQTQDAIDPIDEMWTQQEQIRISPPMVLVPFRVNSQEMVGVSELKEWGDLQLNVTMLNSDQFQMATETTRRILSTNKPNQNTLPSRGNGGHVYVNQEEQPMNPNLSTSVVQPHSKYEQGSYCTWTDAPMSERHEPHEESCPLKPRKKPTNPEIKQTFHRIPEDRSISSTRYGPSFDTKHQRSKKDKYISESRSSNRQPQGNQETYFEQPSSHSQSVYNYDRDNQDLHRRVTNSLRYPTTQSNTTCLTWIKPDRNSEFVARSNATTSSTEVETLMQPRKLRSKKSTEMKNRETPIENSVLLETRTPCNRESLIETCGQPPSYFRPQQYTGLPPNLQQGFVISQQTVQSLPPQVSMSAPQNRTHTGENYIIDPRDQWRTVKSPVSAPVMQSSFLPHPGQTVNPYQQTIRIYQPVQGSCYPVGLNSNNSGCQSLTENIKLLPPGFYDQTVRKYNISRMDSNFQPPSLRPEILNSLQAHQQCFSGLPAYPYSNQFQQQFVMNTVPSPNQQFTLMQNQYQVQQQNPRTMFCPQQNVRLSDFDQSECII